METQPVLKNIADTVVEELANKARRCIGAFAEILWTQKQSAAEPQSNFDAVVHYFLKTYKVRLTDRRYAVNEALQKTANEIDFTRAEIIRISAYSAADQIQSLKTEVASNRKLVEEFIVEERKEIDILKEINAAAKKEKDIGKDSGEKTIKTELLRCLYDVSEQLLTTHSAQVRNLEHKLIAIIDTKTMDAEQASARLSAKIDLLKNKLSILEENLSTYGSQLQTLDKELADVAETLQNSMV